MVFVYFEGAYTVGSVVSSVRLLFLIHYSCRIYISNLTEVGSRHSREMLLWMIFYSISVLLWYQYTKRRVDFRSEDIFKTSVACLDILAFLNSFEDFELYVAALSYAFFKQRGAKIYFARDQWLLSNNPNDQCIDDFRVPYKRASSPRDF